MRRSTLKSLWLLNWLSLPSRLLPHGLCGAVSLLCGSVLVAGSIVGSYAAVRSWLLPLYLAASAATAAAGLLLVGRAPSFARSPFKYAAVFQLCLVYHAWRFFENRRAPPLLLDWIFAAATVIVVALFAAVSAMTVLADQPEVAVAIVIGSLALLLLAGYPVQLALGGEEWWTCVQERYPLQALGMVAYIYVPTIWTFSAVIFGATLLLRKVVSSAVFAGVFVVLVLLTLVGTVIAQEVHLPSPASTQRLYLPCPEPEALSWRAWAVDVFDTSVLAQGVLRRVRSCMAAK
mmetsp:Transcript_104717/g.333105  ORF Transcript_104717/g.333105 Transcript_104717/m.333105 type:complete len:290 (+) Transcript_104717:89-958(+)